MKNKGITLIELLVAISLLTLIIMAGSGIYLSGWNMFRNAQVYAQAQRNAMIPMAHMVKNLQDAVLFTPFSGTELRFTEYTTLPTITIRRYIFDSTNGRIQYDADTTDSNGNEQVIGRQILFTATPPPPSTTFSINANSIIATITITATDNNDGNPYTLNSVVEARYGAVPPV